ncbi:hypothetical protein ACLOJK_010334 [Asimina triloba]
MAKLIQNQLQKFPFSCCSSGGIPNPSSRTRKLGSRCCSALAIDAPASSASAGIRWGSSRLQGPREEMEDDVVIRSDGVDGFSFAAVFDGHAGFSSVEFLRDELYKECLTALQSGPLLNSRDFKATRDAIKTAFANADAKLLNWLEETGKDIESGSTATVLFVGNNVLIIAHVISRSGKAEVLTNPHRPYGNNKVSLQEIRRIREAGGWIVNGRICGDISISRAFGDMRFKTKKTEMLEKGVEEGKWTQKFISRSDAVAFVRNQLRQHGDVQVHSDFYVSVAWNYLMYVGES